MTRPRLQKTSDSDTQAPPREIELKLELAAHRIEALLEHPVFNHARAIPGQSGLLRAVYYDTPQHALRHAGLSLRIRERKGRHVQTIKAERPTGGLALDRSEWEGTVDGTLDWKMAASTPLAALIADASIRDAIRPAFVVETERRVFEVEHDEALIEVALDLAQTKSGEDGQRFAEVELELKKGNPSALFSLACQLKKAVPLRLSTTTKSDHGYRMLGLDDAEAVHAKPVDLPPGTTSADAFQIIARACLSQIVQNEVLVRRHRDSEALHQMRVGLRRLNAARSLFKTVLKSREGAEIARNLRWLGKKLGHVRDLDVYRARLREAGGRILERVEEERDEAYDALLRVLEKPRFMSLVLDLAAWVESGKWLNKTKKVIRAARGEPVEQRAARKLARRLKRIRKRAKHIAELDEKQRHRLRMRIKLLRYGAEFHETTFPGRQTARHRKALLAILEDLQDDLGEMNDIAVAERLFPGMEAGADKQLRKLLCQAEASARKLQKTKPFWDEARSRQRVR